MLTVLVGLKEKREILPLGTNGGDLQTNLRGNFGRLKEVWAPPEAPTNIVSFGNAKEQGFPNTYVPADDAFILQSLSTSEAAVFERHKSGLCTAPL